MPITNALASVAVKDIQAAAQWYLKVIGRPADSMPTPELAEWKFLGGGCLQVFALPERAGACSCTLSFSSIDAEAARLEKIGILIGALMGEQSKVFMIKDPDGNSIAFAQAPNETVMNDAIAIARAAYDAYVTKDRAAIEALIADDFHFSSHWTTASIARPISTAAGQTAKPPKGLSSSISCPTASGCS